MLMPSLFKSLSSRYNNCFRKAFTFVEVLITVGIIGIVAALVLPSILTKIQRQRDIAVLKVAYSDLHQYVKDFDNEMGCAGNFVNCTPGEGEFAIRFSQYLVNRRGFTKLETKNWVRVYSLSSNKHFSSTEQANDIDNDKLPKYIISKNGMYMYGINQNMYDNYYNINGDRTRAWIKIFTNSSKFITSTYQKNGQVKPASTWGRNVFSAFVFNSERVIPGGGQYCSRGAYYCTYWTKDCNVDAPKREDPEEGNLGWLSGDGSGFSCLGRIIEDGWKMNY